MYTDAGPRSDPSAALSVDHTAKAKQAFAAQPVVLHRDCQREGRSRNEISTCFNLYPTISYLTRSCLFILICMSFVDVRSGLLPKF